MLTSDRELDFRQGMPMRWEVTADTEETGGQCFEAINWVDAMSAPPVHVHPEAEESYEVIEGELEVYMDGTWSPVRAGEMATVSAGTPHSMRNVSGATAKILNIHAPAQRHEAFFRHMHRLIQEGRIKALPPKDPRSAIYAAMLSCAYPDEIRAVGGPGRVFSVLNAVGEALRFKL